MLDEIEQNIFARFILDEVKSEGEWNNSFVKSKDFLLKMVNEALCEYKIDQTELYKPQRDLL